MARAHYRDIAWGTRVDGAVVLLAGATVTVRQTGTSTLVALPLYAGPSGGTTLANPLTSDANGGIEFWMDTDERVDLLIAKTGYTSQTVTVDVTTQDTLTAPTIAGGLTVASGNVTLTSGKLGIGTAPGNPLLDILSTATTFAVHVRGPGNLIGIDHSVDAATLFPNGPDATLFDMVDMTLTSTGDGIYVAHAGGRPPGWSGNHGAQAAFNCMVPYYLGNLSDGRNPAVASNPFVGAGVVNTRIGQKGLTVAVQPPLDNWGIAITEYCGINAALSIGSQPAAYPQGNGTAITVSHGGTGPMVDLTHHDNLANNASIVARTQDLGITRVLLQAMLVGDANPTLALRYNGQLQWGVGGATALDTTLSRSSAGRLNVQTSLRVTAAAAGGANFALGLIVSGDNQFRWQSDASGLMSWGDGTAAPDTNLYRPAADRLKSDDHFQAALGIATKVKAGIPVDADWAVAPADGTAVVDSTDNRIYWRVGGVWKYAALT